MVDYLEELNKKSPKENLKLYLLMRHGTIARAGQVAGVTADRVHQILCGLDVPESPDTIKRFSEAWDVDIVRLTQIFISLERGRWLNGNQFIIKDKINELYQEKKVKGVE